MKWEARLSRIADEVDRTHERVTITRNRRSYLLLVSVEDLESMDATLELLRDPAAVRRVQRGLQDLEEGRGTSAEEMQALMQARRSREGG